MNRKEALRQTHQQDTLHSLGFSTRQADTLRRISMTLRRWHELECGIDGGCIERDNDGRGGMTTIRPWQLHNEIKLYTDKIPPRIVKYGDTEMSLDTSPDSYIDELVTLALHEKDLKRAMKTRILFTRENQVFETKKLTAAELAASLAHAQIKDKLNADQVLNLLPMGEALSLYTKGMQ